MLDSRFIWGFAVGAGLVFVVMTYNGFVTEPTIAGIQKWLSALSGWAAAGGALVAAVWTVRWARGQFSELKKQNILFNRQNDAIIAQYYRDKVRNYYIAECYFGNVFDLLKRINQIFDHRDRFDEAFSKFINSYQEVESNYRNVDYHVLGDLYQISDVDPSNVTKTREYIGSYVPMMGHDGLSLHRKFDKVEPSACFKIFCDALESSFFNYFEFKDGGIVAKGVMDDIQNNLQEFERVACERKLQMLSVLSEAEGRLLK